ncbi:uncharacterized protein EDB91DRAFT_214341 [Suillus paluster]|uniref:uncharacterized protein n=1 Tax=Suillus paluster TaxID=48578 RepID=UPI001B878BFE|nr:uncharacterized protein EDB91DRAFT_214341 [Suillus paluster]KAG1722329.1 hypothetical protein EDB91DRAFT_214341 [Suillus paluster]
MSFSRLGQAPDQDSMGSTLQSCLESLDRLHDRIDCVCNEMLWLRARIAVVSCQLGVTVGDQGTCHSSADMQTIFDDEPQMVTFNQLIGISLLSTLLDLFLLAFGPRVQSFRSYEIAVKGNRSCCRSTFTRRVALWFHRRAQPFPPQHSKYPGGRPCLTPQNRSIPKRRAAKTKQCAPGCSRLVKKENRTCHVNEIHRRKVKAVCADCGKGFTRSYMKKDHICRAKCKCS